MFGSDHVYLHCRQFVSIPERTEDESGNYESILPEDCTLLDDCKSQLFKDAVSISSYNYAKSCLGVE